MKAGGGQAILNLILSIILVIKIGFVGVMLATLISYLFSTTYVMKMIHNHLRLPIVMFLRKTMLKPIVISFVLGVLIYLGNLGFSLYSIPGRFSNLAIWISEAVFFFMMYSLILSKANFLDRKSIVLIKLGVTQLRGIFKLDEH